jgi:hypothetical protein
MSDFFGGSIDVGRVPTVALTRDQKGDTLEKTRSGSNAQDLAGVVAMSEEDSLSPNGISCELKGTSLITVN